MKKSLLAALATLALTAGAVFLGAGPAAAALTYFYAGAEQFSLSNETTVSALLDPEAPTLTSGDFHTLGEIAVENSTQTNIVEIGWTVDPTTFGDSKSRLMIYHWINGTKQCYVKLTNLCGFTLNTSRLTGNDPGRDLTSFIGTPKAFAIGHFSGAWWVSFDGDYIGSFADSRWSGAFTTFQAFQGFGEVAANVASPTTDMGKGFLPTGQPTPTGAGVTSVSYSSGTAGVNLVLMANPNPTRYLSVLSSTRSMRFGGPGW